MLSYTLIHSLDFNTGPDWEQLIADVLGQKVHPDRVRGFCLAREALRKELSKQGKDLKVNELHFDQFDRLKTEDSYTVSLSHTPQWGAAVLADRKTYRSVGIDIEFQARVVKTPILERISHPEDLHLPALHIWVIKEACFKSLMNTRLFDRPIEFSTLLIQDKKWIHLESGVQGEWNVKYEGELILALAWIKI